LLAALPQLGLKRDELPQLQRDPAWMDDIITPLETRSRKVGA
jgi:hypothetical protein